VRATTRTTTVRRARSRPRTARLGGLTIGVLLMIVAVPARAGADTGNPTYYVAVGGSASVGFQPTAADPRGAPTDTGYADDLLDTERSVWPDLRLVQLGCPGATTATMLEGGRRCHYREGSQLAEAVDFLHHHSSTVLMTIDVGFNNVSRCMEQQQVDDTCVTAALDVLHDQLAHIVSSLRGAGDPHMRMIGVGHYDPYLADDLDGPGGKTFSAQSLAVMTRLNDVMHRAYRDAGVPMADVSAAFETGDDEATDLDGVGSVPRDVARVCTLTWMCAPAPDGPNPHPNDAGYRVISRAISDVLSRP
jgi:lysophospholipase L1-like esterase